MDHVAIMRKSWGLTNKILLGTKTIESRWYKHKSSPWGKITIGDCVYFKDSGGPITVKANVSKVVQVDNIDNKKRLALLKRFSQKDLGTDLIPEEISKYMTGKRYAIFVFLNNPQKVTPFNISKKGFGMMSAWITCKNINDITINSL